MNAPTERKIGNRVIQGEPSHDIKVAQFFVGSFGVATAKAIKIVFCAMVGGGKAFIDQINRLVGDRFQRVWKTRPPGLDSVVGAACVGGTDWWRVCRSAREI